jgi:hypothetical protein
MRWIINYSEDGFNTRIEKKLMKGDFVRGLPKSSESYSVADLIRLGFYGVYEKESEDGINSTQKTLDIK